MSIADYSDLLGQCVEYTGRDDCAHMFPRFVSYCESKLNRQLRIGKMEAMEVVTTDMYGAAELPDDVLEVRQVANNLGEPLKLMAFDYLDPRYRYVAGKAVGYGIFSNTMHTMPLELASQFTISYYAKIPSLSVSNTTNWLLQDLPLLYLYGVSAEIVGWALTTGRETDAAKLAAVNEALKAEIDGYERLDRTRRFSNMQIAVSGVTP